MMDQRRMDVVRAQTAWMLMTVVLLVILQSLSLELFVILSIVGLLVVTELTTSISVTPDWRRRLRWLLVVAVAVAAYLLANRILTILPPGVF